MAGRAVLDGPRIGRVFKTIVIALTLIALVATVASAVILWQRTKSGPGDARHGNARPHHAV